MLLGRFSRYLTVEERGLVTLDDGPALHRRGPRKFSEHCSFRSEADLKGLTSAAVTDFVLSASRDHYRPAMPSLSPLRLRSFLRLLVRRGLDRGRLR